MFGSSTQDGKITSFGDYVDRLRSRMQHAHDVARDHMHVPAQRRKELYDGKLPSNHIVCVIMCSSWPKGDWLRVQNLHHLMREPTWLLMFCLILISNPMRGKGTMLTSRLQ